jgi:hypothetical protein
MILCKRETNHLLDAVAILGNFLQSFVNGRVKVLLATLGANPRGHTFDENDLSFEMESRSHDALFNFSFAKLARIMFCHLDHLSFIWNKSRDNQQYV